MSKPKQALLQQAVAATLLEQDQFQPLLIEGTNEIDWQATGLRDGKLIEGQEIETREGLIGLLVELGEKLSQKQDPNIDAQGSNIALSPAAQSWLTGYGEARGKSQKSEAKAVFEACACDRDATETAALEVTGNGVGNKSRYHQFIDKCRDIRGRKPGGNKGGERSTVSAAQVDAAVNNASKMNGVQATDVLRAAVQRVASLHMPDIVVVRQIHALAESLRNHSQDEGYKAFGTSIENQAMEVIQRHQKTLDDAKAAQAQAVASKGVVPTPAMQHLEVPAEALAA